MKVVSVSEGPPVASWLATTGGGPGVGQLRTRQGAAAVQQAPNPSIEGTSNIRLRPLSAAPHVKR